MQAAKKKLADAEALVMRLTLHGQHAVQVRFTAVHFRRHSSLFALCFPRPLFSCCLPRSPMSPAGVTQGRDHLGNRIEALQATIQAREAELQRLLTSAASAAAEMNRAWRAVRYTDTFRHSSRMSTLNPSRACNLILGWVAHAIIPRIREKRMFCAADTQVSRRSVAHAGRQCGLHSLT
jgi:hypothetical protein